MESNSSERVEVPANFEEAPIDSLVQLIADMLDRLMAHNDQIPLSPETLTRFHSRSAPSISVLDYLKRIVKFTNVEKSCLLILLFNIDQICSRSPWFTLSSLTCHRFIITSITVTSKGLCDAFCPNNLYAKVGGITVTELNLLEREFLKMIDWRLMCTRDALQEYYVNLVRTYSTGQYFIAGANSPSMSPESDLEMDSGQSCPPSPKDSRQQLRPGRLSEPSAILVEPGTNAQENPTQRPTIEQNMAFAALQQSEEFKSANSANYYP
ncbi:cyclin-domain-containing protein [Panaeolus papilionaceus]|nr:cyclin-domain-containing protein [Panaeolus papilionaceus]